MLTVYKPNPNITLGDERITSVSVNACPSAICGAPDVTLHSDNSVFAVLTTALRTPTIAAPAGVNSCCSIPKAQAKCFVLLLLAAIATKRAGKGLDR